MDLDLSNLQSHFLHRNDESTPFERGDIVQLEWIAHPQNENHPTPIYYSPSLLTDTVLYNLSGVSGDSISTSLLADELEDDPVNDLFQKIVVLYVWTLFGAVLRSESSPMVMPFWMDACYETLDENSRISVLSTVFYDWIMKLIQTKLLTEPQHTPTPEDLYIEFITGILGHFFERTNITCSSSEMNDLVAQILDVCRPLTHSSFFATIWEESSSYSTYQDVCQVLLHNEQVFLHQSEYTITEYTQDVFWKQRDIAIDYIKAHRSEWLFSDFLTVLQQLSKGNSNTHEGSATRSPRND
ncbi:hypothetical protein BLNAU_1443 [Blattamonas nauphoetae]|uniref:Uncharacterized protein n=1 Tax=Blattamonas nauphoetae TaxID=2049346 RepID=A0ABQ9YI35_9EUKA|nr:hypothetical protein BLNAU_1443 [Blattamonas nauphoetae]